uniref:Uncharacterized protein n=1 Tax=Oryza sativa subsp. japonica TaxID=39947 RepID=Q2QMZ4_ORYSJ|nr:hypothetical protein LOC_Os12g39510 [Oryza sativa Japonica Group]
MARLELEPEMARLELEPEMARLELEPRTSTPTEAILPHNPAEGHSQGSCPYIFPLLDNQEDHLVIPELLAFLLKKDQIIR